MLKPKHIVLLFCLAFLHSCLSQQRLPSLKSSLNRERKKPIQQIAKEKQYIYGLDLTSYQPYEIYINNILIAYDASGGGELIDLRPWLLHNGTYTITVKLTPSKDNKYLEFLEGLVDRISFVQFLEDTEGGLDKSTMIEQDLPLIIQDNMPYLEQSWDVEITNLPYELEGWRNGQDLSKWDKDILQKKAVLYYERLRTVLNNGDAEKFNDMCLRRVEETNVFNYNTGRIIREEFEIMQRIICYLYKIGL
ncbi:hypothetical protein AX016_1615 [Cellulophaga sp. RHA19]|nr:hypothetical protein AX016_1615 [Cellulophaga sp. RHA19]